MAIKYSRIVALFVVFAVSPDSVTANQVLGVPTEDALGAVQLSIHGPIYGDPKLPPAFDPKNMPGANGSGQPFDYEGLEIDPKDMPGANGSGLPPNMSFIMHPMDMQFFKYASSGAGFCGLHVFAHLAETATYQMVRSHLDELCQIVYKPALCHSLTTEIFGSNGMFEKMGEVFAMDKHSSLCRTLQFLVTTHLIHNTTAVGHDAANMTSSQLTARRMSTSATQRNHDQATTDK